MKHKNINRLRVAAALLALVLALSLAACKKGSDVPLTPGLSVIEGVPVYDKDVAMQTDHFVITPGMMAYFFYTYGASMIEQMESEVPFDDSKNLHDQMYTDTLCWYDAIMNVTLERVTKMLILCEAGQAEGLKLTDEQQEGIENALSAYRMDAVITYDVSLEEYLQAMYGPLMTEPDLRLVLEMETFASAYSQTLSDRLEQGITAEAVQNYIAQQSEVDNTPSRNIAFLFIAFENGAIAGEKVAAVENEMRISPSAATLQALTAHGTYGTEENLTPKNSGIEKIAEWLFAEGRRVGDWERIDLSGATYIVTYTGNGMTYSEVSARMALYDTAYANWYNTWVAQLTFGYNYDCLDGYDTAAK